MIAQIWNGIINILTDKIILEVIISVVICQVIKLFTKSYAHKKIYWKGMCEDGGMPSSHTVTVVALSTAIGLSQGFTSPIFFVAGIFSIIVMRDAIGVRRNVDRLRDVLNDVIKSEKLKMRQADLVTGHTLPQVVVGFLLAVACVLVLHFWML
ncbi:MAG: divergent PAP2 family protein [Nanoarchaeota archaeon]|nr:divergent PAP2 family protein [Nanoarchaeota archaeon]